MADKKDEIKSQPFFKKLQELDSDQEMVGNTYTSHTFEIEDGLLCLLVDECWVQVVQHNVGEEEVSEISISREDFEKVMKVYEACKEVL